MSQINRPKLWQAILKGCDNAPQGFYKFKEFLPNGSYRTCAIGAAFDAVDNIEPYIYQLEIVKPLEEDG